MDTERTLSIIKPDATRRNLTGRINALFEEKGLRIIAQKRISMTREQAETMAPRRRSRPVRPAGADRATAAHPDLAVADPRHGGRAATRLRDRPRAHLPP